MMTRTNKAECIKCRTQFSFAYYEAVTLSIISLRTHCNSSQQARNISTILLG